MYFSKRTKILTILAVIATLFALTGCTNQPTSAKKVSETENSPFNTENAGAWRNEENFLRMTNISEEVVPDGKLEIANFQGGEFPLPDRQAAYAFVILVHNTSDTSQTATVTLSFAPIIRNTAEVTAEIAWKDGAIIDQLTLLCERKQKIGLLSTDDGTFVSVYNDDGWRFSAQPDIGESEDGEDAENGEGKVPYIISVGEIPAGETRTVFVPVGTVVGTQ